MDCITRYSIVLINSISTSTHYNIIVFILVRIVHNLIIIFKLGIIHFIFYCIIIIHTSILAYNSLSVNSIWTIISNTICSLHLGLISTYDVNCSIWNKSISFWLFIGVVFLEFINYRRCWKNLLYLLGIFLLLIIVIILRSIVSCIIVIRCYIIYRLSWSRNICVRLNKYSIWVVAIIITLRMV